MSGRELKSLAVQCSSNSNRDQGPVVQSPIKLNYPGLVEILIAIHLLLKENFSQD